MLFKNYKLLLQLSIILVLFALTSCLHITANHEALGTIVQSNLNVDNWIYGGLSEQDLKKSVFEQMTQNFNILKCNLDTPFFNGEKCIACSGSTKYFNVNNKQCQSCGNVVNHQCQ